MPKMPRESELMRHIRDLRAATSEHLTDEQLTVSKLWSDQLMYGFCAIDQLGNRVDPMTIHPQPNQS